VKPPRILVIAGSDSGGGAGIQADIKTVTMLGGHAMTAITALTAQNTLGVTGLMPVPAAFVVEQMEAVLADLGADAVKIGMIGSAETAHAVAERLERLDGVPIVFDPVMVATSGAVLAGADTIAAFERLMRISKVVTPNVPELAALVGRNCDSEAEGKIAAEDLAAEFGCAVLAKGGHRPPEATEQTILLPSWERTTDLLTDWLVVPPGEWHSWSAPRIDTRHTHGTGCTLASALATFLARGLPLRAAVARARQFVHLALREAPELGRGHGPLGQQRVRLDLGGELRLNHVTLPLTDFGASYAFYQALGLTPIVRSPPRYARFECEGGATLSIEAGQEVGGAAVYLECIDLDGVVAELKARGIAASAPVEQSWRWREAWLADPAGNRLCLYQADVNRRYPPWRL
jgi:hydroxymethylpyrimidine/phosphomethylpyrimidine kinase